MRLRISRAAHPHLNASPSSQILRIVRKMQGELRAKDAIGAIDQMARGDRRLYNRHRSFRSFQHDLWFSLLLP
jgi:hypothetical protein